MSAEFEIRLKTDPYSGRNDITGAMIRVRARKDRGRDATIQLVDIASETAYTALLRDVPRSGPGEKNPKQTRQTIASSIDPGDRTSFSLGGAGGGGFWDRRVGLTDPPKHLRYVMEGVGPAAGHGSIVPTNGNIMTFRGNQGFRSPRETKGRPADREWFDNAFEAANEVLRAGLDTAMSF